MSVRIMHTYAIMQGNVCNALELTSHLQCVESTESNYFYFLLVCRNLQTSGLFNFKDNDWMPVTCNLMRSCDSTARMFETFTLE